MTHRFVAVDVGTGDAFFIQRGDFVALVDGGQAQGFPRRLHRATSADAVNVLVCTHNDRDHANGILEFLEEGCMPTNAGYLRPGWRPSADCAPRLLPRSSRSYATRTKRFLSSQRRGSQD